MPIVYDGTRGSSHGDLFAGLKLFISLRVPQRERWANLVEGNGGEVVRLEKQADMLIADHVKRSGAAPPPGSYSWQWIEYSVKNGFLQPRDDYRIEGVPAAGASAPTKGKQRVKFTKEDDEILANFVLNHERQGNSTRGNVIFEDLYKKYTHHTAQSWRDRWVKYVSNRPRPNLPREDAQSDARVRGSPGHDPSSVDGPPQSQAGPSNLHSTAAESPASTPRKQATAKGRNKFTQEDDEILLRFIRERREIAAAKKIPEDLDGNKIYQAMDAKASLDPCITYYLRRHPWRSWRDRWVRHLSVRASAERDDLGVRNEEERPEEPEGRLQQHSGPSRDVPAPRTQAKSTAAFSSAAVSSSAQSPLEQPRPRSDDERLKRQEQNRRRARAAKLLQRTWRGHIVRRDRAQLEASIVPLQSLMRGYLLRMRKAEGLLDALEANAEPTEDDQIEDAAQYEDAQEDLTPEVDGNDSSLRDQFYEDLLDYLEVSGAQIERHPVVDGREVELWDLFSVATQQDCAIEDRDWKKVAQRLGFDWTSSAGCANDLKACYDRNLAEFEEAIGSYDDHDTAGGEEEQVSHDDEAQGLPQTSDAVTAPKEPSGAPFSPPYRSSSPVAGVKRSFQQSTDPQSELGYPSDGSGKRRRRDRGKAIPQTPDHELGLARGSNSRAATQDFSSPLKSRGAATGRDPVYSMDDADNFLNNGMHDIQEMDDLPDLAPPRKKRFIEPETQDFGVFMGGEDVVRQSIEENIGYTSDDDDISPSQQLQSEFDAISSPAPPVPIRGNGTASANRPPFVEPRPRPTGGLVKDAHNSASGTATTNGSAKGGVAHNRTSTLKATKRSLPQQYQAQPTASAPIQNAIATPALQSRSPVVARPTIVAPAHSPDVVIQKSRPTVPSAQTRQSMGPPTSSAPVPDPARNRDESPAPNFNEDYIDAQFEHFTALGYDPQHIGRAMEVTSMQRGPMTVALQSLQVGKGLPRNVEGVWTDEDDNKLREVRDYDKRQKARAPSSGSSEDVTEKARVERYRAFLLKKHKSWCAHRQAFMDMMDDSMAA